MMRRSGRFRHCKTTWPEPGDEAATLEQKYSAWIEAESFKR